MEIRKKKLINVFTHFGLSGLIQSSKVGVVIGSLLLCLLPACSSTAGLKSAGKTIVRRNELYLPVDKTEKKTAWFNISIKFFKNEQSGQLLVKQTNDTTTRVLFTTPVGFKIFDFAITPHDFKVLACIEPLRKKKILRIMEKDFRLMFFAHDVYAPSKRYTGKNDTSLVVYKLNSPGKSYYWINKQRKDLYKIDNHAFPVGGAMVSFDYTDSSSLPTIRLKQKGIKLRFELVPFNAE